MEEGLALFCAARCVTAAAVFLELDDMSVHGPPTADLAGIILAPSPHIVATVPLKPATGILWTDPALLLPHRERLTGVDAKKIESFAMPRLSYRVEFRIPKPRRWKLLCAIAHVAAAKHPECEHLLWREFRFEGGIKIAPDRFGAHIRVAFLHLIVHCHAYRHTFAHTRWFTPCAHACGTKSIQTQLCRE